MNRLLQADTPHVGQGEIDFVSLLFIRAFPQTTHFLPGLSLVFKGCTKKTQPLFD